MISWSNAPAEVTLFVEVRAREPLHVEADWWLRALVAARLGLVVAFAAFGIAAEQPKLPELPLGTDDGEHAYALLRPEVMGAPTVPVSDEPAHRTPADLASSPPAEQQRSALHRP